MSGREKFVHPTHRKRRDGWGTRSLRVWTQRLMGLVASGRRERELAAEIESHLEMHIEDNLRAGMDAREARRQAILKLGGVEMTKQAYREQSTIPFLETLMQDLRLATRQLRKSPGFVATAVLTLAIGIGATTTIFTILDAAMLRSLPVRKPSELVSFGVHSQIPGPPMDGLPMRMADYLHGHARSYADLSGWGGTMVAVRDPEGALRSVFAWMVTGNALPMLGVRPYLGRLIESADDVPGGPVGGWPVVLNYDYWASNFNGDPNVIGRRIEVSGHTGVVVGVTPREFQGILVGSPNKVFLPAHFASVVADSPQQDPYQHPDTAFTMALARLAPGVTLETANAELAASFTSVWREMLPPRMRDMPSLKGATLVAHSASRGFSALEMRYRPALLMLQGVVLLVLLLCCVNLGGLQMARVQRHRHEFAIRNALGAGRARILRQCLTESLLLALVGSAIAAAVAWFSVPVLAAFLTPAGSGESSLVRPDMRVLGFTTAMAVVTTILFGLVPAMRASKAAPAEVLKGQGPKRRVGGIRKNAMISGQFALALVLVFGAGLFTRTLVKLRSNHAGFEPSHVLEVCAQFQTMHKTPEEIASIYHLMTEKLRASPGIEAASFTWVTPLTGFAPKLNVHSLARPQDEHSMAFNEVGDGYFSTVGTRLLGGREFAADDADRSVCVLNQSAAKQLFGGANAVGETLKSEYTEDKWTAVCRVVGIVEDARYSSLRDPAPATIYFAAGAPALRDGGFSNNFVFFLRAANDVNSMSAYRAALKEYAAGTAYAVFLPLRDQVDQSLGSERLISLLSSAFAGVALLLSGIGIFGLLALRVQQRRQEIGVRMAIGADRSDVLRMILGEAVGIIGVGTLLGVVMAAACGALVRRFLYGVTVSDPWVAAGSVGVLLVVGLVAAALPARRAASVNPVEALRAE